jgi:hypothetical protein
VVKATEVVKATGKVPSMRHWTQRINMYDMLIHRNSRDSPGENAEELARQAIFQPLPGTQRFRKHQDAELTSRCCGSDL